MGIPCKGLRRLGEEPPPTEVVSASARETVHRSMRCHFEMRIASSSELMPPTQLEPTVPVIRKGCEILTLSPAL